MLKSDSKGEMSPHSQERKIVQCQLLMWQYLYIRKFKKNRRYKDVLKIYFSAWLNTFRGTYYYISTTKIISFHSRLIYKSWLQN